MVVGVQPEVKGGAAFGFGGVGLGVGPFVSQGAVEPSGFAVGLGPVGARPFRDDAEIGAGRGPGLRAVAGAVEFLTGVKGSGEGRSVDVGTGWRRSAWRLLVSPARSRPGSGGAAPGAQLV